MRILVVGSGGREHALVWALARSPQAPTLFTAPGNPGTEALGTNVPIEATDTAALQTFAAKEAIDLTIVGPEQPLVAGIVDAFRTAGLPIVGPTAAAARLEGSKAFAKEFMQRYRIPTATYRTFDGDAFDEAAAYVHAEGAPLVVKASGLAAGKGALVCATEEEALAALQRIMVDRAFGAAGDRVVIEEFMTGEEASVFALTDGEHYVVTVPAQDHKRAADGDTGPNTGGMGAYAPAPVVTGGVLTRVCRKIIEPTLAGMAEEGHPYTGILYCGLMIADGQPRVVEYNCRLGDPEAQVVLPLLQNDLADVFMKTAEGALSGVHLRMGQEAAACVVMASGGYPGPYATGKPITGLEDAAANGALVFHAGTARTADELVTDGGRVLGVTALGATLKAALDRAYSSVGSIHFDEAQYRTDIGRKGLARL
ncbi:MAG: phosphoribosylamine--glycine ligase [Bacteroidetes bacterium]|jgi:phosphoribosylamine--glycine ligase|nr:phosphoribosylamine--glycine ligase [Bacteroidota bacterium]